MAPERLALHYAFQRAHKRFRATVGEVIAGPESAGIASSIAASLRGFLIGKACQLLPEFAAFWRCFVEADCYRAHRSVSCASMGEGENAA